MDYKMLISLFTLFLCVVGSSGCTYFSNNDSLNESDVQLHEGWTFNKNESGIRNYEMNYITLVWDYNSELSVFISEFNNQSQYEKDYNDSIKLAYDYKKEVPGTVIETKIINIEGINVILEKCYDPLFNGTTDEYYFQKNGKYYSVYFNTHPENGYIAVTEPYRVQIDEAIKSIIKTI